MNIFLIGFMGSGKSSLGKRLANKLKYEFIDLDTELENTRGMTVNEIFNSFGESSFREMESDWIKNFDKSNCLISLGGGTPCFNDNMSLINKKGLSIYLKVSSNSLTNRLHLSKSARPLIANIKNDKLKLKEFIDEMMTEREKFYLKANIHFDGESVNAEKLENMVEMIRMSD